MEREVIVTSDTAAMCRGTSPIRKRPPPDEPLQTLGMGLRWGPRGVWVREVPLCAPLPRLFLGRTYRGTSLIRNSPPRPGP